MSSAGGGVVRPAVKVDGGAGSGGGSSGAGASASASAAAAASLESPAATDAALRQARRGSVSLGTLTDATVRMRALTKKTNEVVGDKKAEGEKKRRGGNDFSLFAGSADKFIWLYEEKDGFVAAKVITENKDGGAEVELTTPGNAVKTVKKAEIYPFPILRLDELKTSVEGT